MTFHLGLENSIHTPASFQNLGGFFKLFFCCNGLQTGLWLWLSRQSFFSIRSTAIKAQRSKCIRRQKGLGDIAYGRWLPIKFWKPAPQLLLWVSVMILDPFTICFKFDANFWYFFKHFWSCLIIISHLSITKFCQVLSWFVKGWGWSQFMFCGQELLQRNRLPRPQVHLLGWVLESCPAWLVGPGNDERCGIWF